MPHKVHQEGRKMRHAQTAGEKKCTRQAAMAPDLIRLKAEPEDEEDPGSDGVVPDWYCNLIPE